MVNFVFWLLKELIYRTYIRLLILPAIPLGFIILAVKPFILIRFIRIRSQRIGHFASDTELMLCHMKERVADGYINLFYTEPGSAISNIQLYMMWKRVISIIPFPILMYQIDRVLCFVSFSYRQDEQRLFYNSGGMKAEYVGLLEKHPRNIFFTKNELEMGVSRLPEVGMSSNSKFVCIQIRDAGYLSQLFSKPEDEVYAHRNGDINNYKKVALYLAEKGYYVLRMGKVVNDSFNLNHPRVIDYANHKSRSDFMDIYLAAHCSFYISNGTGLDAVASIFRRPQILTDLTQLNCYYELTLFQMILPRKCIDLYSGRLVLLKELISLLKKITSDPALALLSVTEHLRQRHMQFIDSSPDELVAVVDEMLLLLDGCLTLNIEDQMLQKIFWEQHKQVMMQYYETPIDIKRIVSPSFLRQNKAMLLPVEDKDCDLKLLAEVVEMSP